MKRKVETVDEFRVSLKKLIASPRGKALMKLREEKETRKPWPHQIELSVYGYPEVFTLVRSWTVGACYQSNPEEDLIYVRREEDGSIVEAS